MSQTQLSHFTISSGSPEQSAGVKTGCRVSVLFILYLLARLLWTIPEAEHLSVKGIALPVLGFEQNAERFFLQSFPDSLSTTLGSGQAACLLVCVRMVECYVWPQHCSHVVKHCLCATERRSRGLLQLHATALCFINTSMAAWICWGSSGPTFHKQIWL